MDDPGHACFRCFLTVAIKENIYYCLLCAQFFYMRRWKAGGHEVMETYPVDPALVDLSGAHGLYPCASAGASTGASANASADPKS